MTSFESNQRATQTLAETVTSHAQGEQPGLPPSFGPYESSEQHLWDELRRVDYLVRAQTVRWRLTTGASKPQHLWGMIHVTDAEVDAVLKSDFLPPHSLPREIENALINLWLAASELNQNIRSRVAQTPPAGTLRCNYPAHA